MAEALVGSEPIPNVDGDAPPPISHEVPASADGSRTIVARFINGSDITNGGYNPGDDLKFGPVAKRLVGILHNYGFLLPLKFDTTVDYDAAEKTS